MSNSAKKIRAAAKSPVDCGVSSDGMAEVRLLFSEYWIHVYQLSHAIDPGKVWILDFYESKDYKDHKHLIKQ